MSHWKKLFFFIKDYAQFLGFADFKDTLGFTIKIISPEIACSLSVFQKIIILVFSQGKNSNMKLHCSGQ